MREINSNLDKESASQMQFIVVKEAIEALEKAVGEFQSAHTSFERLGELENRIKVLEDARQVQRQLNAKFESGLAPQEVRKEPTKIPVKEVKAETKDSAQPKSIWSFWK